MKSMIINTPEGQYKLPVKAVAEHRANFYAENDGFKVGGKEWKEEVKWVMDDKYELINWLLNNTDWDEWEDQAFKMNDKIYVSQEDFWTNTNQIEIIKDY